MSKSQKYNLQQLNALFQQGHFVEIAQKSQSFLKNNPGNADVLSLIGVAHTRSGQLEKAKTYFKKATMLKPESAQVFNNLANAQRETGFSKDALVSYEKALQLNPQYQQALNGYGNVLMDLGLIQDAIVSYQKLLKLNPDHPEGQINLAQAFIAQGEFDHAKSEFQRLLEKNPRHAEAHQQFSRIHRYQDGDDHIKAMQSVLAMPNPSAKETVLINHGLGKAHADLKDYPKAFEYWQTGNRAFKDVIKYGFTEDQEVFDRLHQWADHLSSSGVSLGTSGAMRRQPIFILGMPRSGTSLIEQILSGHSTVYAAGELDAMGLAVRKNALSPPPIKIE